MVIYIFCMFYFYLSFLHDWEGKKIIFNVFDVLKYADITEVTFYLLIGS